nr:helix-hairpin-helix domain-containing protein [Mammaliicoccus sp. Marseille-Q6498]
MEAFKKIKNWCTQNYQYVLIGIIALFVVFKLFFGSETEQDNKEIIAKDETKSEQIQNSDVQEPTTKQNKSEIEVKDVIVDIKGAVQFPKTYEMKSTDRINDVLKKAQIKDNADLSKLNLSEKLKDQMYIYVPVQGEHTTNHIGNQDLNNNNNKVEVDINSATKEQIQKIPGIGPSKADAIIQYRESKGEFKSIDDLKKVKGFGEKTVDALKEYIVVN